MPYRFAKAVSQLMLFTTAALALSACQQQPAASAPAETAATSAAPVAASAAATPEAPAAASDDSNDAVRALAKLDASDLAFRNPQKDALLARFFDARDSMGNCHNAPVFDDNTEVYLCGWSKSPDAEMPNLIIALNMVRADPYIYSALVHGNYGPNPLGPAWICGPDAAYNPDLLICTLKQLESDRPEDVARWNRYLQAAG